MFDTNFTNIVLLSEKLISYLNEKNCKTNFVIFSSVSGEFFRPIGLLYSISKKSLSNYFEYLPICLKSQKITTSIILIGQVKTKMTKDLVLNSLLVEDSKILAKKIFFNR